MTALAATRRTRSSRRPLRWLLVAEAVSLTGTRVSFVAVPWLVLETTGSAARMGIVAFGEMLPYVAACALGGPVADQRGPRRVSIVCDVASAAIVALVPLLATTGHLPFGALVALMVVAGAGRGLGDTAKRPLLPSAVEASGADLTRAAAQRDGVFRLADLLGGPLGGLLVAWLGAAQVLLVDAASFGGAALVIGLGVRLSEPRAAGAEAYGVALRTGIRFLRGDALIGALMLMVLATNLFDQAYAAVLLPVWAHDRVGSAAALGLVVGAFGAGAVLGNLAFTAMAPRLPRFWAFTLSFLLGGAPRILVMAVSSSVTVVAAVGFTTGLATAAVNPILAAVGYERIPRHLQARVLGMIRAVSWAGIPVGGLVGGLAVDGLGLTSALLVVGSLYLVVTLVPLAVPVWRELDVVAPTEDPRGPTPQAPTHHYAH
ncbi:MAG: MFS transporter [Acidimicrobiales bacterium]